MATSTIPAFKSALVARLQADSDLSGVQVTYGWPGGAAPDREWVWVGGARSTQAPESMGQRRQDEAYTLDVIVSVLKPFREDQETITERAFELAGFVEESIRTWGDRTSPPVYGTTGVWSALISGIDLEEFVSQEEREARVTVRIDCKSRI